MPCLQLHSNETDYFFEHKEFPVKVEKINLDNKKATNKAIAASFIALTIHLFFDIQCFLVLVKKCVKCCFIKIINLSFCSGLKFF